MSRLVWILLVLATQPVLGQQIDAAVRWQMAKKLSLDPVPAGLTMPPAGTDFEKMVKGDVGDLAYWNFEILQVVDEKNLLLSLGSSRLLWLTEFPTSGLADGDNVRLIGLCEMVGTKQYANALGSTNTVRQVKMLTEKDRIEWEKERQEKERMKDMEVFVSKSGHKVTAKFLGNAGTLIRLETEDGRKIAVQLSEFADESADRVRELIAKSKK